MSLIVLTANAQTGYPVTHTSEVTSINHKIPKGVVKDEDAITASFASTPKDEEFYAVHFFEEPLIPSNGSMKPIENTELLHALVAFSQRKNPEDFSAMTNFLSAHNNSRWKGSLLANLGIIYRRTGYYNKALDAWQESWILLKDENDAHVKALADKVLADILTLNAWVGRKDYIDSMLTTVNSRVIRGSSFTRIASVKEALWYMKNKPEYSFKCGPYALSNLFTLYDTLKPFSKKMMDVKSTPKGFTISQLKTMAQKIGLKYQIAFRNRGADIIPMSVVHWKLDHYSALIKYQNGYYLCRDLTVGSNYSKEFWLSKEALDSSASGYFLIPYGKLKSGWRTVSQNEGNNVFGKGDAGADKNGSNGEDDPQTCPADTKAPPMAQSNVHLASISLHVFDRPLYYIPPKGLKIDWKVSYHQKETSQTANFNYSNLGYNWTFNWLSYVEDDPNNPLANALVYFPGGGVKTFTNFDTSSKSYLPELKAKDVLVRICPNCYELRHPDGSVDTYARTTGDINNDRKIFLTKRADPSGNTVIISYDNGLRILSLTDALGQVTKISYDNPSDSFKISKVTDPFERSASFNYDANGELNSITDMIGIVSSFQYDANDFIISMMTPYGKTSFITKDSASTSYIEINYPLGEKERVEYRNEAPGINKNETISPDTIDVFNDYMNYRNTFYWDRKAMATAPGVYTQAKIYHWLHGVDALGEIHTVVPILESEKSPLENRIWYRYSGQDFPAFSYEGMSSKPAQVARVLDTDTTQIFRYEYNELGMVDSSIDPSGRKFKYVYDSNKIDLLEVRQVRGKSNELLAKYTYNKQHLPLTAKDASGLTTKYTYNAAGQLLTVKNPKNETTTLSYDGNGYLKSITGAIPGATVSFEYDGFGRIKSVTDPEGYTIKTDYDKLDRPTLITYPDSSYEQIVYDKLDAVHHRDRLGRWSHNIYDSLDRLTATIDALSRVTQFIWCSCGSLAEIVDPLKNVTTFTRDIQGRLLLKTYADNKSTSYFYENTSSRLKSVTDAKGQTTSYNYLNDDNLKNIAYTDAQVPTPSVSYTYDTSYNRITSMTDGTGKTTYTYKKVGTGLGSGKLSSENPPLTNDVINYTYDSLGRISTRSINGVALILSYDALGRITSETNTLGAFAYSYVNQTQRVKSMTYPNGQTTAYDYFDNNGDERLKEIWNKASNSSTLSKFNYAYNKEGQITKWTQQSDAAVNYYDLGYDLSDQLTSATLINQSTANIVKRYAYQYNKAGNRTSEQIDNTVTSSVYNTLNQLTNRLNNGPIRFKGSVNEFSSVVIKNTIISDSAIALVDSATNSFEAFVKTTPGKNSFSVTATDYSGNNNKSMKPDSVIVGIGITDALTFDDNGNTISEANPAVTYGWDAKDQLVKITKGDSITDFVYDGLSRRVIEKLNGTIIKRWLWCGTELCEERNAAGGTVTKRFFNNGEQINGTNYYFTKDHLGSVIEMTDASGVLKARYGYDPYGRRTKVAGSSDADFGFTGHYYHGKSELYLTLYRAYNANSASWLNRDPTGESSGLNLYQYVFNDPITFFDPFGTTDYGFDRRTGTWSRYPSNGYGPPAPIDKGYSGAPGAVNDPSKETERNVGPIPGGDWQAGVPYNNPKTGPYTIPLTPLPGTDAFGRDAFRAHGDNKDHNQTASEGCIVLQPDTRKKIKNGDVVHVH